MNPRWDRIALIAIAIIILLIAKIQCNRNTLDQLYSINAAMGDSLHITTNKLGQEVASRKVFQSSAEFFKRQVRSASDSLVMKLMAEINRSTVSNSHFITSTSSTDSTSKVTTSYASGDSCNPIYRGNYISAWDSVNIRASRDKIVFSYVVYNEFKVEQFLKRRGLFKQPDLTVSVTNLNPNTRTLGLQSFHVPYPNKRFGIGPAAGIGFTGSFQMVPIFGIVATYSIIQF